MKSNCFLLLCACVPGWSGCSPHQPPTAASDINSPELQDLSSDGGRSAKLLAVGDWSEPVKDAAGYALRGRLLIFETPHFTNRNAEWWGNAPIYLELQNRSPRQIDPVAVYFALGDGLECDLRDAQGRPAPVPQYFFSGGPVIYRPEAWITIPADGSVRVRGDVSSGGTSPRPNGLNIHMSKRWSVPFNDTNLFLFSGTFSPPTNHPIPPDCHVWSGILKLPPVKLQMLKP